MMLKNNWLIQDIDSQAMRVDGNGVVLMMVLTVMLVD